MNKYQKALETFNNPCYFQDFILLKELVERATPKETIFEKRHYRRSEDRYCPKCDGRVGDFANFCYKCGQALTMKKEEAK